MPSSDPIDVLIIGLGAIGTVYGWILSQNEKVRVTAIARSTYQAMHEHGIHFQSAKFGDHKGWKPYRIVPDANAANDRPYKYIIMSQKCILDLLASSEILAPFLDSTHAKPTPPTVVLIQNGIGIEHPIQKAYPKVPIISTVSWIGTNLHHETAPRVSHGKLEKLVIGLYRGEGEATDVLGDPAGYTKSAEGAGRLAAGLEQVDLFAALLTNGGGTVEVADDIQPKRYNKTLWNSSFGVLCALSRSPVSALVAPDLLGFTVPAARRLMLEVTYVARAMEISEEQLPLSAVDEMIKLTIRNWQVRDPASAPATPGVEDEEEDPLTDASRASFKPSILLDLEAGRPMELEAIVGSLLERARVKGVETPRLDTAYAALKVNQDLALARLDNSAAYHSHLRQWDGKQAPADQHDKDSAARGPASAARIKLLRRESANVAAAGGKSKLTGKPVATMEEAETEE